MNDYFIQDISIDGVSGTLVVETLGDTIKVSERDVWDITWDTKTGLVESWKVNLDFTAFLTLDKNIGINIMVINARLKEYML